MRAWVVVLSLALVVARTVLAGDVKSYAAHGLVRHISDDRREVTIQHDAIPGYMMGMTMAFAVHDTDDLAGIASGDEINFTLAVGDADSWVQNVKLLAHHVADVTSNTFVFHADSDELHPGDLLPDGT